MAKQTINIGTIANDGTGSTLRAAGDLINDNFNEIYTSFGDGSTLSAGFVTLTGTETLTNKTLTSPEINSPTGDWLKIGGTDFTNSILIGHNTTGTLSAANNNIGIGANSLDAITSGDFNVAIGVNAGSDLTTSSNNVFLGQDAGRFISTSIGQNMYIGSTSGYYNQTGQNNVAVGINALKGTSLANNSFNTSIGSTSLSAISTGDRNIAIGYQAGDNITSGDGNVIIGDVDADSATGDRQLKIAGNDGSTTTTWISGDNLGNLTFANDVTVTGDLTVNGATTTVSSTNTTVTDNLLELNSGAASNANDTGIIMERGSTGDNAIIAWDESADKFILGTTTATASDTGNLTITAGTIVANLEGNVTGAVTGNADTATALATGRTIGMTGDVVWTSASFDGTGNVTGTASIQANTITSSELSGAVRLDILDSSGTIVKTLFGSGS